jgi:GDPmannose 4,6-dehydratase
MRQSRARKLSSVSVAQSSFSETSAGDRGRRALITGITGQDGSYLAELLLEKGYEVHGLLRGPAGRPLGCSEHLRGRLTLTEGDLADGASLRRAIELARPAELYHLASSSFVPDSWRTGAQTLNTIAGSTATLLQALGEISPDTRMFLASSGAIFGNAPESPQNELTPCRPNNPYAIAKLAAHGLVAAMREHDGLFVCSGILFNHESERRPERFVTRRITRGAAEIALGLSQELTLGDLDAVRDWSFAGDVMHGAWMMLQAETPEDYVLASGVPHTVAEFARSAFARVDLDAERYLRVDPALVRDREATPSVGDSNKARTQLGWSAAVDFDALVERMVAADLRLLQGHGSEHLDCPQT